MSQGLQALVMSETDLLHDTSLSLGEGDVTTRLVLDELDLDLSALTATFLIIVIVIVSTSHGSSGALSASGISTVASQVITRRRMVETGVRIELISHDEFGWMWNGEQDCPE